MENQSKILIAEKMAALSKKAVLSPRIGKHGKAKKTLILEKMQEAFIRQHLEKWNDIIKSQLDAALKNQSAREYSINQIIGRPKEFKETADNASLSFRDLVFALINYDEEDRGE